jgi:hypothetical protein
LDLNSLQSYSNPPAISMTRSLDNILLSDTKHYKNSVNIKLADTKTGNKKGTKVRFVTKIIVNIDTY